MASWRDRLKKEKAVAEKTTSNDPNFFVELDPTFESEITIEDRLKAAATAILLLGGKNNNDPRLLEALNSCGVKITTSPQSPPVGSYTQALAKERQIISEDRADAKFPGIEAYVLDRLLLYGIHSDSRWAADPHKIENIAPKAYARFKHILRRIDEEYESLMRLMR